MTGGYTSHYTNEDCYPRLFSRHYTNTTHTTHNNTLSLPLSSSSSSSSSLSTLAHITSIHTHTHIRATSNQHHTTTTTNNTNTTPPQTTQPHKPPHTLAEATANTHSTRGARTRAARQKKKKKKRDARSETVPRAVKERRQEDRKRATHVAPKGRGCQHTRQAPVATSTPRSEGSEEQQRGAERKESEKEAPRPGIEPGSPA